ncbi:MMPL family transporter [Xanthomarina sp. F1114]|uniref:MMPL family transporter n=1 Tax=Xanthomarina sp. F1114 TaxID=2996019 RepID=UPI00225E1B95|nr:MMPL family transporter [Xanthomarina sp. F1114]MCX7548915.1 MMPL family transporter [Xanthomarina sp. F1114]
MTNFFYNIHTFLVTRKIVGFFALGLLVLGLGFLASNITFEEDITKLIPINEENADLQKVLKSVNFADKIIVNIKREPSGSINDLTQYATQFIDSINSNSNKYFTKIQGKVEDEEILNTLDFVYNNLPHFLESSDYKLIENKLQKDSIKAITTANYKTLISPSGMVAKETILRDPLSLSFLALKKLQLLSFGNEFTMQNGFLLSKDKKHILLFISPTYPSSETSENAHFAEQLYSLNSKLNKEFKGKISSEYFGGALVAVANAKQIKKDIQLTVGIAVTVLLLILILFYRKLSVPLILFVPTAFGALLAVALLFLIRTKISAVSLGIGSVLLGITLDYALHILTHIRSNNNVKALYQEITKPILMSSLTTALAFLCLLFLDSQALQDLGLFAAISVLGASSFALIFIPLVYKDKSKSSKKSTVLDKVARYPLHKNKWVLIGLVLLFFMSYFTYTKVTFNNDLANLNFEPTELREAQDRLDALTNINSKSVYIAAYGNKEQDVLIANDSIFSILKSLKEKDSIIGFSSISTLIKSSKIQEQQLATWNNFWTEETKQSLQNNLIESGVRLGFKPSSFHEFYAHLNSDFDVLSVEGFKNFNTISVDDYIATKNDFTTITTLVKLKDNQAENLFNKFKDSSQTLVIDRKQMNETFLGNLKTDFNSLVGYSFFVVLLLLLLFYRSFSLTLVTLLPIALTWLLTIGIMGLFGVEFNIFNIIITTFIFGLGIDYSIFITNGLLHELRTGESSLPTHKTSILLSVITTILGVGVLIFAKHPALHSISLVSLIGILSAMLISFAIQPLLFMFFIGSKQSKPSPILMFINSSISFTYYGLGGLFLSLFGITVMKVVPLSMKIKMNWFHRVMSKFMKSVLYSYPFYKIKVINKSNEDFRKQAMIIANHTSFLDILAIGMLHPKLIFLVNDWVYNSPFFGKAVKLAGFYPVSSGIEKGVDHLQEKVNQGYSLMAFPEGTRSYTNKAKRFHKGAFFLADKFKLDIVPVIIHGNSEVLPKGNFVIKSGVISVKILDRIPFESEFFNGTSRETTKKISAYFKNEFNAFREIAENESYFHQIVLEEFRYKGNALYKQVKLDLKTNKKIYKSIMDLVGEKDSILHFSKSCGQLDFLLALDRPDRRIFTYFEDKPISDIIKNSYLSNNHYKISVLDTPKEVLTHRANVLILDNIHISNEQLKTAILNGVSNIILLSSNLKSAPEILKHHSFKLVHKADQISILTKTEEL